MFLKNTIYSNSTIQGVIDLYYVDDNDNAYLIDFKTDKSMDRNYYIEKYKLQLLYFSFHQEYYLT